MLETPNTIMAKAGGGSRSRHWPSTLQNVEEGQSRGGESNSVTSCEKFAKKVPIYVSKKSI